MNKKLAAALSGSVVLVLALSGCGGDDKDSVDDWAAKYCDLAKPQIQKQAQVEQLIRSTASDGKPGDIQAADSKAFQDLSDVNKAFAAAYRTAGQTPVKEDRELVDAAVAEFDANAKSYLDLKKQIDALDAQDQQKFADGLKPIADGLAKIEQNRAAWNKLRVSTTGKAMAKQPGCKPVAPPSPKAVSAP
ncbi:small secreted protein [Streptomyces sp. NPDC051018]|uniref:small secreted protein n=1 Tax=Streptomyces sp. NPDC051018 TaxID=3365639 RepID=UPI0037B91E8F